MQYFFSHPSSSIRRLPVPILNEMELVAVAFDSEFTPTAFNLNINPVTLKELLSMAVKTKLSQDLKNPAFKAV